MEDIDKELGPLLDNYSKKFEEIKLNKQKQIKENQDFKNGFNQLVENVIIPEMNKYYLVFVDRGFGASILRSSISHEAGHQPQSITLCFSDKRSSYPDLLPAIKFVAEDRKISVYENKFDISGLGCSSKEGIYETYQITESFVKEKLSSFFKALFSKEYSF